MLAPVCIQNIEYMYLDVLGIHIIKYVLRCKYMCTALVWVIGLSLLLILKGPKFLGVNWKPK
jgi:hypothetical protein